ncbi:MAG: hypothetical protein OQL08_09030 [Gammaproteobacteria bacterium]|nr:hypothetical protein [Gammaproteobacteria bacterium]
MGPRKGPTVKPQQLWFGQKPRELIVGMVSLIFLLFLASRFGGDSVSAEQKAASQAQRDREKAAKHLCAAQAKASAAYPGTVDVHWFQGVFAEPYNDGITLVKMDFTAKNAFGAELPFLITCLVNHAGEVVSSRVSKR